jgi:hypothetical protein
METMNSVINKLNQHGSPTLINRTNIGVAGSGVRASEYGNAYLHTTVLGISKIAGLTLADNAALADGHLIYTLPAGAIILNTAYMRVVVTNAEHNGGACELGLGTLAATGAIATLTTAAQENVLTGYASTIGGNTQALDCCNATGSIGGLLIPTTDAGNISHNIYINIAGTWANTAGTALDADISGAVILNWTFMV